MERDEIHGNQPDAGTRVDFTKSLGTWHNTNERTRWIKTFTLSQDAEGKVFMGVSGVAEPANWGEIEIVPCIDNIGENAFLASYQLPAHDITIVANTNKGLWVTAAVIKTKDGSVPNFLCREFYVRPGQP